MNKGRLAAIALGMVLGMAPNVVANAQPGMQPQDPIAIYVDAGASTDQQAKIRALAKEFETTARIKVERANNLFKKMHQLSLEPMPDEKTVLATQEEINNLQADMATSRLKLMLQIRALLSDEQRQKLVALLKERRNGQPAMPPGM